MTAQQDIDLCLKKGLTGSAVPSIFNPVRRIIAIGDIHGDLEALYVCLKYCARVISGSLVRAPPEMESVDNFYKAVENINWIGGDTNVVLIGDSIDRGRVGAVKNKHGLTSGAVFGEEVKIFMLLNRLAVQADHAGGRVIKLLGNHELINLYYSKRRLAKFFQYNGISYDSERLHWITKPDGILRTAVEACGGRIAVKIGSWVFVHGGIVPLFLDAIKKETVRATMTAINETVTDRTVFVPGHNEASPVWNRTYSNFEIQPTPCSQLELVLNYFGQEDKMVVAHSTQPRSAENTYLLTSKISEDRVSVTYGGPPRFCQLKVRPPSGDCPVLAGITCDCLDRRGQPRLWRIDVGMSRGFDMEDNLKIPDMFSARRPQVLEILDDTTVHVIKSKYDLPRDDYPDQLKAVIKRYYRPNPWSSDCDEIFEHII